MLRASFFFVLLVITPNADAELESAITGAFGIQFGDSFEGAPEATSVSFDPVHPYEDFDSYKAYLTPKSRLVYKIQAYGDIVSESEGEWKIQVLSNILQEKYKGRLTTNKTNDGIGESTFLSFTCQSAWVRSRCLRAI